MFGIEVPVLQDMSSENFYSLPDFFLNYLEDSLINPRDSKLNNENESGKL